MQRGVPYGCPADYHRLQDSLRGKNAGAPYVDVDVQQVGGRALGGELVGDGPAGLTAGKAEGVLLGEAVDLDHDAVGLIVPVMSAGQHIIVELANLVHGVEDTVLGIYTEAVGAQPFQGGPVAGGHGRFAGVVEAVGPDLHVAAAGNLRIQLADGAGAGVTGVGVERLAVAGALLVHALEAVQRQVHLTSYFQIGGEIAVERVGDALHLAQVAGDILPGLPVAAGGSQDKCSFAIDEAHRQAVDLELGHHAEGLAVQEVGDAAVPRLQVVPAEGVGQAQHGNWMLYLGEAIGRAAADELGGRAGGTDLGVFGLQVAEFLHQRVVLAVTDHGSVVVVVTLVVEPELVTKLTSAG